MKKYLFVATVLFALSCKNNDSKAKEQATETKTTTASSSLYGKWKVVGQTVNGEERGFGEGSVEFKENGEYIGYTGGSLKFTINGDSLILTSTDNKPVQNSKIVLEEVNKGTLKLQTLIQDSLHIETVFQKEN